MTRFGIIDEDSDEETTSLSLGLSSTSILPNTSVSLLSKKSHQKSFKKDKAIISPSKSSRLKSDVLSSSPSKEPWDFVIQKVSDLETKLKNLLASKEQKQQNDKGISSSTQYTSMSMSNPHLNQNFAQQAKSLEECVAMLKRKNKDMKNQVFKCITDVKKRNEAIAAAEKEEIEKRKRELKKAEEMAKQKELEALEEEQRKKKEREEAAEAKKKQLEEEERKKIMTEQQKQADVSKNELSASGYDPAYASSSAWHEYNKYVNKVKSLKENIKTAVVQQPSIQNTFFMKKMKITQRVGQLTNSIEKVKEIAMALSEIFSEGQSISPLMYEWLMTFTAKAITKQAEKEVAVKKDMAFPLAIVCVLLYGKHELFLDILLGRLMKKCSYIGGVYIKRVPGQSDDEYKRSVGYKIKEENEFENEIQYGERMCGIMALYCAIIQCPMAKNRYHMDNAWIWLSRILNLKPRKITPLLIHTFLEISGHEFLKTFQGQAKKILQLLISKYFPLIPEKAVAAKTRLQLMLEETYLKFGDIPPFEGHELNP